MKKQSIIIILGMMFLYVSCSFAGDFDSYKILYEAKVLSITDGDTVSIRFTNPPPGCNRTEKVRLIGIDTPELFNKEPEFFANEAKEFTKNMLLNKTVYIEFDESASRDYYGRLLAYIRQPNSKENQELYKSYCDVNSITSILNNDTFLFNEAIILAGYSYYYGKYSFNEKYMERFKSAEEMAELFSLGLWK